MFLAFFRIAAVVACLWVDCKPRYNWAVSTGLNGGPPSATFKPQPRMSYR
jgi:hypothetical protein